MYIRERQRHVHASNQEGSQKKSLDPNGVGVTVPVGYLMWELNSSFLEKQQMLLSAKSSLQPDITTFFPL